MHGLWTVANIAKLVVEVVYREIPARKYIHYIDWRGDKRGNYHSLPMTVEITGEPYNLRIIKVTWDGKDEELLREDGG